MTKTNPKQEHGETALNNLIALTSCTQTEQEQNDIIKELEERGVFN